MGLGPLLQTQSSRSLLPGHLWLCPAPPHTTCFHHTFYIPAPFQPPAYLSTAATSGTVSLCPGLALAMLVEETLCGPWQRQREMVDG